MSLLLPVARDQLVVQSINRGMVVTQATNTQCFTGPQWRPAIGDGRILISK